MRIEEILVLNDVFVYIIQFPCCLGVRGFTSVQSNIYTFDENITKESI